MVSIRPTSPESEHPTHRTSEKGRDRGGRLVKLVLVTTEGELLGSLAPFQVASPWWQEVKDVVREALERYGVKVTMLRLLEADRPRPHGGSVTYLAEVQTKVPAKLWNEQLEEHPLRRSWARPGTFGGSCVGRGGLGRTRIVSYRLT